MNAAIPERRPATEEMSGLIERVTFQNGNGYDSERVIPDSVGGPTGELMAGRQSQSAPAAPQGNRWVTAVTSLALGMAFLALWFWLLPRWLGFRVETAGAAHWRWLAAVPSVGYSRGFCSAVGSVINQVRC